jgi:hypothetical protein
VARKKDAQLDSQANAILDQLNTLTAGPPGTSSGLVGDQTPSNVFDPVKLDQVLNQIRLGVDNLEALNALDTIGNVTNTSSSSGPLVGTYNNPSQKLVTVASSGSSEAELVWFRPDPGQVWALQAARVVADGSTFHNMYLKDEAGTTLFIAQETTASRFFEEPYTPIYISYDVYLVYAPVGASSSSTVRASVYRVR